MAKKKVNKYKSDLEYPIQITVGQIIKLGFVIDEAYRNDLKIDGLSPLQYLVREAYEGRILEAIDYADQKIRESR